MNCHSFSHDDPSFKGVDAVAAVGCKPTRLVLTDEHQRSKAHLHIFSAGVCIAIPRWRPHLCPPGAPKTGYMCETMVTAIVENIAADPGRQPAHAKGSWNAICLADMGDTGAAFVALPQIPPPQRRWFKRGSGCTWPRSLSKKYFMHKMKAGTSEPIYEVCAQGAGH